MQFNVPGSNIKNSVAAPMKAREPLRAAGSMDYIELVETIKQLWAATHPGVPIVPHGTQAFQKMPCIVRSLEVRRPFPNEPKTRVRDNIVNPANGKAYQIKAQRFSNVVQFEAATENDPELCERIIETFEDFIHQITPPLKENGVSDIRFIRRIPDNDMPRRGEDVSTRGIAFDFTLEKVYQIEVQRIEEILLNIRMSRESTSDYFSVPEGGSDHIELSDINWLVAGQYIVIRDLNQIGKFLPAELASGDVVRITSIDGSNVYLETVGGDALTFSGAGEGRFAPWDYPGYEIDINDNLATPNY